MSDNEGGIGNGILRGLKKILFTSDVVEPVKPQPQVQPSKGAVPASVPPPSSPGPVFNVAPPAESTQDMKLKVYQLLESMNKPGIDFFEVWNAATEMGGANAGNIKAAFTSLRYADTTLSKAKLLETGNFYKNGLRSTLDSETQKRQEEKTRLDKEKDQLKTSLVSEIAALEQQIAGLQEKLQVKKEESNTINQRYEPKLQDIDNRINAGQQSVNSVIADMEQVLNIIQQEIN